MVAIYDMKQDNFTVEKRVENRGVPNKVRCERCGRIRDLFQYTFFDVNQRSVNKVKDGGAYANPRYTTEKEYIDNSRGLCEPCAVTINCHKYDTAQSNASTANNNPL